MTDSADTASSPTASQPVAASGTASMTPQQTAAKMADERPELVVGAAFAGGLLLAMILKRLAD